MADILRKSLLSAVRRLREGLFANWAEEAARESPRPCLPLFEGSGDRDRVLAARLPAGPPDGRRRSKIFCE